MHCPRCGGDRCLRLFVVALRTRPSCMLRLRRFQVTVSLFGMLLAGVYAHRLFGECGEFPFLPVLQSVSGGV